MTKKEIIKKLDSINIYSIIDKKIGTGMYRDVFSIKGNTKYVVKIERYHERASFANVMEWNNYCNTMEWKAFSKFLAPCYSISSDGNVLLQGRIKQNDKKIKKIPSLFTDTKVENWGWLGKRFVCCDYSFLLIGVKFKMIKAKWWSLKDR